MRRFLSAAILTGSLAGCALLPPWLQTGDPEGGWGTKTVSAKEEPATLVAPDGTLCIVTQPRYQKAKLGDRVWCLWRARGDGGARPGSESDRRPVSGPDQLASSASRVGVASRNPA